MVSKKIHENFYEEIFVLILTGNKDHREILDVDKSVASQSFWFDGFISAVISRERPLFSILTVKVSLTVI